MALPRTRRPPIAAAVGSGNPHRPPLFLRGTTAAAAAGDYNSSKHRPRPFTDGPDVALALPVKRRKPSAADAAEVYEASAATSTSSSCSFPPLKRHPSGPPPMRPEEDGAFISRDEIERRSLSRRDGIDSLLERQLRYSYCAYLQSLGARLQLPQTTTGTAMVLCHRFFVRRSHACQDRFLIATAALFLASKSEETPCLLNTVLRTSCEIFQTQNFASYPYLHYSDRFEQYRERVTEAEQMILTTLDFELDVHHPYSPLTSVLNKLGLSHTSLLNLAWNLVSEGLRTSLWLQFKPHHIAAGATFLAAKFLNLDLAFHQNIWHEFQTKPCILQDVVEQLMELF